MGKDIITVAVVNYEGRFYTIECQEFEYDTNYIWFKKEGSVTAAFNDYKEFYIIDQNK